MNQRTFSGSLVRGIRRFNQYWNKCKEHPSQMLIHNQKTHPSAPKVPIKVTAAEFLAARSACTEDQPINPICIIYITPNNILEISVYSSKIVGCDSARDCKMIVSLSVIL